MSVTVYSIIVLTTQSYTSNFPK